VELEASKEEKGGTESKEDPVSVEAERRDTQDSVFSEGGETAGESKKGEGKEKDSVARKSKSGSDSDSDGEGAKEVAQEVVDIDEIAAAAARRRRGRSVKSREG